MQGLSIHTGGDVNGQRAKCEFRELFDPIQELVVDLHWILDDVMVCRPDGLDRAYEEDIVAQSGHLQLMRPGFLCRFAPYIIGDWDDIVGVESAADFADGTPLDKDRIASVGRVYFACIDAAFWEVYSPNEELLARIVNRFPDSEPVLLAEKMY